MFTDANGIVALVAIGVAGMAIALLALTYIVVSVSRQASSTTTVYEGPVNSGPAETVTQTQAQTPRLPYRLSVDLDNVQAHQSQTGETLVVLRELLQAANEGRFNGTADDLLRHVAQAIEDLDDARLRTHQIRAYTYKTYANNGGISRYGEDAAEATSAATADNSSTGNENKR